MTLNIEKILLIFIPGINQTHFHDDDWQIGFLDYWVDGRQNWLGTLENFVAVDRLSKLHGEEIKSSYKYLFQCVDRFRANINTAI